MGEDLACEGIPRGVARPCFPTQRSDEWRRPEFTCQGFYTHRRRLTRTAHYTHTHFLAFSYANPVLYKEVVFYSTLLRTWPVTRSNIPFLLVLLWPVSRRTPECAGCLAACRIWECVSAIVTVTCLPLCNSAPSVGPTCPQQNVWTSDPAQQRQLVSNC